MKRVWLVSALVAVILILGILSLSHLNKVTKEMEVRLDQLADSVERQDKNFLEKQASDFEAFWEDKEHEVMRYIHHDELDTITGTVARLSALAKYEDYSELAAEIDRLRHLVRHIYESELPSFQSIF